MKIKTETKEKSFVFKNHHQCMYVQIFTSGITFDGSTHLATWQRAIPVAAASRNKQFGWKTCVVEKR